MLALLANDDTRRLFARVALGEQVSPATKRETLALERLVDAGVLTADGRAVDVAGLRRAIESFSPPRPEGIARFVRDNRIVDYPASDSDRRLVLEFVGAQVLAPGERVGERELNERLHPWMEEHVLLRRYLIDYNVLIRSNDGAWYERRSET